MIELNVEPVGFVRFCPRITMLSGIGGFAAIVVRAASSACRITTPLGIRTIDDRPHPPWTLKLWIRAMAWAHAKNVFTRLGGLLKFEVPIPTPDGGNGRGQNPLVGFDTR